MDSQEYWKTVKELEEAVFTHSNITYSLGAGPVEKPQRYCFFLDIDGCIFEHQDKNSDCQFEETRPVLPGVKKFFEDCGKKGHIIVLTSGRRHSMEAITRKQLQNAGLSFDALILGCTNAIRVLINDTKPYANENNTAIAYSIPRDSGLEGIIR